jgi:hypothetical protein
MPAEIGANPQSVTLNEIWKNVITDQGIPITGPPTTTDSIVHELDYALYGTGTAVFGSGVDGKQTFDGTSTITLWNGTTLAPASTVYTLTQDLWLADGSSLVATATIKTAGFRIFCNGNFIVNGTISYNGNAAVTTTVGAALTPTGTISTSTIGSVGGAAGVTGTSWVGGNGGALSAGIGGGTGGVGGSGDAATYAGGNGGVITAATAAQALPFSSPLALLPRVMGTTALILPTSGSGGGGGGGDGTHNGGAGGGGAGIIVVASRLLTGTGNIQAIGGAGSAGTTEASTAPGGGGGGGGGVIFIVSPSVQVQQVSVAKGNGTAAFLPGLTLSVAGGAGGAAGGSGGVAGTAGGAGTLVLLSN